MELLSQYNAIICQVLVIICILKSSWHYWKGDVTKANFEMLWAILLNMGI